MMAAGTTRELWLRSISGVVLIVLMIGALVAFAQSRSAAPSSSGDLAAAKAAWEQGPSALSYETSMYFRRAAADLTETIADGASDATVYRMAVRQLEQLASLPQTSDTGSEKFEARRDLLALNRFFDTKGLYG
jgi:hypothetical protein